MADKPIIFSGEIVKSLLDRRKTQTRRVTGYQGWPEAIVRRFPQQRSGVPYLPNDRLWVREPWQALAMHDDKMPSQIPVGSDILYVADRPNMLWDARKRHARFMMRWMSRLTLIVTEVRVERVQDISEDDAKAEGIPEGFGGDGGPVEDFICFWNKLHGAFAFNDNDWVAALTFTAHQANIDDLAKREVA